jgi:hypothetical protein
MYSVPKKLFPIATITSLIGLLLKDFSTERLNFELHSLISLSENNWAFILDEKIRIIKTKISVICPSLRSE